MPPECRTLFGKTKSRIKAQLQSLNNEQLEYIETLDKSPDPDTAESRFTSGYPNSPVVLYDHVDSLFNVYMTMLEAGPKEVRSHVEVTQADGTVKAGRIARVNTDGTFKIDYEDGPDEDRVKENRITVTKSKSRRRRLKVKIPVDEGAVLADEFLGVMWYSVGPVLLFAIFHWHILQYIYFRNRKVREATEKFAMEEGMRGPMYGEEMAKMVEDLSVNPGRLAYYESLLPPQLRESLQTDEFRRSCKIWFMDLDQDENVTSSFRL